MGLYPIFNIHGEAIFNIDGEAKFTTCPKLGLRIAVLAAYLHVRTRGHERDIRS